MWNRRRIVWMGVLAPVVLLLGVIAAWAIDTGAATGEVLRNVELDGEDIGGLAADDLLQEIEELGRSFADRRVRINSENITYQTTAGAIGLAVDTVGTTNAALDEGRTAMMVARPFGWLASFVRHHEARIHYTIDLEQARTTLRQLEGSAQVLPVEPTIQSHDGAPFVPVEGEPGTGIDAEALARDLVEAVRHIPTDETIEVEARQGTVQPRLTIEHAEEAAEEANSLTAQPLAVVAADRTLELTPADLRRLVVVIEEEDGIGVTLDAERTLSRLNDAFADLTQEPVSARFTVENNVPQLHPGTIGRTCCELSHVTAVEAGFQGGTGTVELELAETEPDLTTEEAEALGIVQEIGNPGGFGPTTRHACCESRVTNIHRIADLVRGVIIEPGETFSVNDHVGRRTVENGFVAAGVIYNGEFTEDIGGGVSQFATTFFNAALYAGLDVEQYQSHSIEIDRYPKGREATLNFPNVDLKIHNNTDYGVLVWPTYTDTSITVHLYSTPSVDVSIGDATPSPAGRCTTWTTPRTRTFPDGTVDHDTVHATYRPGEGQDC